MILSRRPNDDDSSDGFTKWPFMTTHTWAENPRGTWRLEVSFFFPNSFLKKRVFFITYFFVWTLFSWGGEFFFYWGELFFIEVNSIFLSLTPFSCGELFFLKVNFFFSWGDQQSVRRSCHANCSVSIDYALIGGELVRKSSPPMKA